jgi:predicted esterase
MPAPARDPHAGQLVRRVGPDPKSAPLTVIFLHGRGASADSILALYPELDINDCAALAPQAAGHTWYPHSFLAPLGENQPYLGSALAKIESIVSGLLSQAIPPQRLVLLGFSQGACLSSEFVARHPRPYGALLALTGGLAGPPGTSYNYPGSLAGTRVLLASGDPDPHVPFTRVQETADVFTRMGATVDLRHYPHRPHTISDDELTACKEILKAIHPAPPS